MKRSKDAGGRPTRRALTARARDRDDADAALRTSGHNCPLCLQPLARIAGGRIARRCGSCGAQAMPEKSCSQCHGEAIWEAEARAACQACGSTGSRVIVVADDRA